MPRHSERRGAIVAGQHDDGDALRLQRRECRRRRRLDRIGDGEEAGELAVDGDENDRGTVVAQALGVVAQRVGGEAEFGKEFGVAERDAATLDQADRALAGRGVESDDALEFDLSLGCRGDDRRGERMLAGALDARGKP